MPTTEITFRGVPYTNTVLFTALVNAFLAGREDVCEQLLADFDEVEFYSPDEWEHETLTQSVNWRHSVRWFDQSRKYWRVPNRDVWREYGDRPKFRPKRKEVK